jgi:XRE family aerobic/anaerobic benzoate catabolism transcriptional regulator
VNKKKTYAQSEDDDDNHVDGLLTTVGARVRKARETKALARRLVSEKSGVSPRYLAQIEAGEGNISIGLLKRISLALDIPLEWLVWEDDPWSSDTAYIIDLYRKASPEIRTKVSRALLPEGGSQQKANRVCLLGLRGAGKSTLGAMAGATLDVPFLELNREIERRAGMSVNEVYALYGQEGYRQLESEAVTGVIEGYDRLILAVAGGIASQPDTYNNVLARFNTIWIKASPDEHMARVQAQGDTRPMSDNPEAMEQLKSILRSREESYRRADLFLNTHSKTPKQSLADLVSLIAESGFFAKK